MKGNGRRTRAGSRAATVSPNVAVASAALAGVALAAALGLSGCGDVGLSDRVSRADTRFPVSGAALAIEATNAAVRIDPGAAGVITVQRSLIGKAASAGNATWEWDGSTLRLGIRCDGISVNCSGRYDVRVPPNIAVAVNSDGAAVHAVGLRNGLRASAHDANVRLENVSGRLLLSSSGGSITSTGTRSDRVSAVGTDGSVRLSFAAATRGVRVTTRGGGIDIAVPSDRNTYRVDLNSRGGGRRSTVPNDTASWREISARDLGRSVDGSIRVHRVGG